jgi:thiamine biosynthesis protein ThiS
MTIRVNGDQQDIPEGSTITSLLHLLKLPEGRIAVERNRQVVPRSRHSQTQLLEGDCIELVRFVGGG